MDDMTIEEGKQEDSILNFEKSVLEFSNRGCNLNNDELIGCMKDAMYGLSKIISVEISGEVMDEIVHDLFDCYTGEGEEAKVVSERNKFRVTA